MLAAVVGNRRDQELDIVLISAQGRPGHPQPDQGLRQGSRVRVHRDRRAACAATSCPGSRGRRSAIASRTSRAPRRTRRSSSRTSSPGKIGADASSSSTVDGPESPAFSPDGRRSRSRRCRAASPTSSRVDLETRRAHEHHEGRHRRLRADVLARRQVDRLHGARRRQRQAVPARPRDRRRRSSSRSAAHDDTGAKFFDDHTIVFTSTATDPNVPMPPEVAQQREHPERLDARPAQRASCGSGPTRRPATSRRSCCSRPARCGSRSSRTTRARTASTSITGDKPIATVASSDFGAPGPVVRFHAAAQPHAAARQHPQEGRVREDDAGGPAAGQPRRHERRQLLRQHADHVHRRARRQADQLLRPVGVAVPHDGVHLREHRAPAAVRAAGLLAGSRSTTARTSGALYDPSLAPYIDARSGRGRAEPAGRHGLRHLPVQPVRAASSCPAGTCTSTSTTRTRRCRQLAEQYQVEQYGQPLFRERPHAAARRLVRQGDDGVP